MSINVTMIDMENGPQEKINFPELRIVCNPQNVLYGTIFITTKYYRINNFPTGSLNASVVLRSTNPYYSVGDVSENFIPAPSTKKYLGKITLENQT